jgi:hypothetical protein
LVVWRAIGWIEFAAREYIGTAQNIGQTMALDQKHFGPLWAVAQDDHGRCVPGWRSGDFRVQFHGVALVAKARQFAGTLAVELAVQPREGRGHYFLQDILCRLISKTV